MRRSFNGSFPITRPFGVYDPAYSNYPGSKHPGTDYGMPLNTPLVAGIGGVVTIYNRDPSITTGRGKEVVISSANMQRKTCHMNRIDVVTGQKVVEGQAIGISGSTGYSTGPHLHDELLIDGQYVDLEVYLKQGGGMSTVGPVELDMLSKAFFGYAADQNFINAHQGKETNGFIRWCDANPAHKAWLDKVNKALAGSTGEYVPYTGVQLFIKK